MTLFDQLFFNSFNYYKKSKFKRKATSIAIWYITLVQLSFLLVLGVFFAEFFNKMNVMTMSSAKAWTLFVIVGIVLYFKNWIQYSGKKRKIINARQSKSMSHHIITLWCIPLVALLLALLFLKVF